MFGDLRGTAPIRRLKQTNVDLPVYLLQKSDRSRAGVKPLQHLFCFVPRYTQLLQHVESDVVAREGTAIVAGQELTKNARFENRLTLSADVLVLLTGAHNTAR